MNAIQLNNVVKIFSGADKQEVVAIDRISLSIEKGEILSLVGPDGSGKTTLIRMMCGVLPSTEGTIKVFGLDIQESKDEIKKHIGYLSQRFSLYHDLTIDENIDFFAEIHKVKNFNKRKEELLEFTRLNQYRNRLAGKLSGGMKQKLALACTLIHTPQIIFLDEPTTGVDPLSRRDFWKILSSLLKLEITIVVSTPYLDESERSTRVAMMNQGKILLCDKPEVIKSLMNAQIIEIICSEARKAYFILQKFYKKSDIQLFGDRLHICVKNADKEKSKILRLLINEKVETVSIRLIPPSLEDVFIAKLVN